MCKEKILFFNVTLQFSHHLSQGNALNLNICGTWDDGFYSIENLGIMNFLQGKYNLT